MNEKKLQLVIGISMIIIVVGILAWFFYSSGKTGGNLPVTPVGTKAAVLNTDINSLLKDRRTHGDIPITTDKTEVGRDNPFLPY